MDEHFLLLVLAQLTSDSVIKIRLVVYHDEQEPYFHLDLQWLQWH